jgi:zinc protease
MTFDRREMPVPGAPPGLRFPSLTRSTLVPGLQLWSVERRDLPLVHVLWLWHAGNAADAATTPGLAALTADMLDEGTDDLTMPQLHDALARIGGQLDTDIGHDATVLSLTALSAHRERAVALLLAMAERPRFDEADLDRVRGLRRNRLRQLRHSAASLADLVAMQHLFGDHPYGRSALGTETSLSTFDVDAVRIRHAAYAQTPVTIVAVGDIAHTELERLVSEHMALAARGGTPRPLAPYAGGTAAGASTTPADRARLVFVPRRGAAQSELRIGRVAAARSTPDYHALVVTNTLLGGAFVSRINSKLREEKGVTYGARSAFQFLREPGPFLVNTSVQSDATSASVRDVLTELDDLGGDRPVTPSELASAQGSLTRGYARGFETVEQVARSAAQLALFDLPLDTFDTFVDRVEAVTADDVTRLARSWLRSDDMHAVVVGDPETAGRGMDEVGLGVPEEWLADDLLK